MRSDSSLDKGLRGDAGQEDATGAGSWRGAGQRDAARSASRRHRLARRRALRQRGAPRGRSSRARLAAEAPEVDGIPPRPARLVCRRDGVSLIGSSGRVKSAYRRELFASNAARSAKRRPVIVLSSTKYVLRHPREGALVAFRGAEGGIAILHRRHGVSSPSAGSPARWWPAEKSWQALWKRTHRRVRDGNQIPPPPAGRRGLDDRRSPWTATSRRRLVRWFEKRSSSLSHFLPRQTSNPSLSSPPSIDRTLSALPVLLSRKGRKRGGLRPVDDSGVVATAAHHGRDPPRVST
jgi:hypothetical protein